MSVTYNAITGLLIAALIVVSFSGIIRKYQEEVILKKSLKKLEVINQSAFSLLTGYLTFLKTSIIELRDEHSESRDFMNINDLLLQKIHELKIADIQITDMKTGKILYTAAGSHVPETSLLEHLKDARNRQKPVFSDMLLSPSGEAKTLCLSSPWNKSSVITFLINASYLSELINDQPVRNSENFSYLSSIQGVVLTPGYEYKQITTQPNELFFNSGSSLKTHEDATEVISAYHRIQVSENSFWILYTESTQKEILDPVKSFRPLTQFFIIALTLTVAVPVILSNRIRPLIKRNR